MRSRNVVSRIGGSGYSRESSISDGQCSRSSHHDAGGRHGISYGGVVVSSYRYLIYGTIARYRAEKREDEDGEIEEIRLDDDIDRGRIYSHDHITVEDISGG